MFFETVELVEEHDDWEGNDDEDSEEDVEENVEDDEEGGDEETLYV